MKKQIFFACLIFFSFTSYAQLDTALTITEVMFYSPAGENEFIEIYNTSAINDFDLYAYKIRYANASPDAIVSAGYGTVLPPKKYAVIFEHDYDIQNGIYKNLIPPDALILRINDNAFGSNGMSNTTNQTIALMGVYYDTLDVYTYSAGNAQGFSDEKIAITKNNDSTNWRNTRTYLGSPGGRNSVTPYPNDLWLRSFFARPVGVTVGHQITLSMSIENIGQSASSAFSAQVFIDVNRDSIAQTSELLTTITGAPLPANDSAIYAAQYSPPDTGTYFFICKLIYPPDNNIANNIGYTSCRAYKAQAPPFSVIVNEIMYAPLTGEPEWIELYNRSGTAIDLRKAKISDRINTVSLPNKPLNIPAGGFLVCAADSSILQRYPYSISLVTASLPTFNNDSDYVVLRDSLGNVIDEVHYTSSWGGKNGYSLERKYVDSASQSSANWATCVSALRGTPGKVNTNAPKAFDAAVNAFYHPAPYIISGEPALLRGTVKNAGTATLPVINVLLYRDLNNDSIPQAGELQTSRQITSLAPGAVNQQDFSVAGLLPGVHRFFLIANIPNDEDSSNNARAATVQVVQLNEQRSDIVINEIMYAPRPGEPEWIELYNRSAKTINIKNYAVADEQDTNTVVSKSLFLPPHTYCVIAEDSSLLQRYTVLSPLIVAPLPSLNNTGDRLMILDSLARVIDSLRYVSGWGGANGTSLERYSPDTPSTAATNWRSATAAQGATPGYINSIAKKQYDAALTSSRTIPAFPIKGDTIAFACSIINIGDSAVGGTFTIVKQTGGGDSLIYQQSNIALPSNGIVAITTPRQTVITRKEIFVFKYFAAPDQDTANNIVQLTVNPSVKPLSIVINELMPAPAGDEPEWIELYNNSADTIDLYHFSLRDSLTSPSTAVIQTHAPVLPKAYLVIARDSSLKYYYAHAFPVVTLPALPTLNNTEDGLKLYSDTGVLLDSMYYSATGSVFSAGISLERINAGALWTQGNWGAAATRNRATPGYVNSLTPKLNDCRMTALRSAPQFPAKGDSIRVEADITRTDGAELLSGYVRFSFRQSNGDSSSQFIPVQISRTHPVVTLQPPRAVLLIGDSITVTANIFFTDDPDTSNDYQTLTVRSGIPRGGVVINEIMFDPAPGQPEWIEMYNASAESVNLRQWKIADNAPQSNYATLTSGNYYLDAGKYLVVARDSLPGFSEPYLIAAFGALNNDSDKIFLRDNRDALIDSAGYTGSQFISRGRSIERVTRDDGSVSWSLSFSPQGSSAGKANSVVAIKPITPNTLIITEIMYEPGSDNSEYIELYNTGADTLQLAGIEVYTSAQQHVDLCEALTTLPPGAYNVLAANTAIYHAFPALLAAPYVRCAGVNDLGLVNSGAPVWLKDFQGRVIDSVIYSPSMHIKGLPSTQNRALERINYSMAGTDKLNWSTSASAGGGTPGERNSVSSGAQQKTQTLICDPNPFSPDNDGFEDFTLINFSLPFLSSFVTITIFDDRGRLLKKLIESELYRSSGTLAYDGRDENGNPLRMGMYIILLEAKDAQTGKTTAIKYVLVSARKL